jgi:hypothetical protein
MDAERARAQLERIHGVKIESAKNDAGERMYRIGK